jgi:hypothetical protein
MIKRIMDYLIPPVTEVSPPPGYAPPAKINKDAHKSRVCHVCHKRIGGMDMYRCAYCGEWYCGKHMLPETHGCRPTQKSVGLGNGSTPITYKRQYRR